MQYLINRLDNEVKYTIDYGITYIGNDLYPINDKFLNELAAKAKAANLEEYIKNLNLIITYYQIIVTMIVIELLVRFQIND